MAVEVKTMEVKKPQQLSKPSQASSKEVVAKGQWKNFLSDIKTEFKKINWTSPEELKAYTKIVVIATFCFGMGIYIMDLTIQLLLNGLSGIMRLMG